MAKREENMESCPCGCNWWVRILGMSLSALWVIISIITCLVACGALICAQRAYESSQASYNLNVLSAGWEENLKKMNELYSSEAYVNYATEQTDGYVSSFLAQFGNESDDTTAQVEDETDTNIAGGEDIKTVVEDMLASSPIRWDENARFTIVEYTELHCPFCQRHAQEGTINAVIEQFPGEVNSISRHFIIHGEDALNLAAAMECVSELKPDVYHEAFEKAFDAYPVDMDTLISIATELGVDETGLKACVDEGRYVQAVNDMMNQGSQLFGVNWTPGNVIIDRETGNYRLVSGAYPVDEFVKAINELKNA